MSKNSSQTKGQKTEQISLKARASSTIRRIQQQINNQKNPHVHDPKNPNCCDHRYVRNVLELKSNLYLVEPSIFTYPQRQFQDMKILNARSQADEEKKKGAQEQREQLRKLKEDYRKEEVDKVQKIMDQINKDKFSKVHSHIKLVSELPYVFTDQKTQSKAYSISKLMDRLEILEEQKEIERSKVMITQEKEKTNLKTSPRQEDFLKTNTKSRSTEISKMNVSKTNNTHQSIQSNQESRKQLAKSYIDIENFISLQKSHRIDENEAIYMVKNLGKPFISDLKNVRQKKNFKTSK